MQTVKFKENYDMEMMTMNGKGKFIHDNPLSRKIARAFDYNGTEYPRKQKEFIEFYKRKTGKSISSLSIDQWIKLNRFPIKDNLQVLAEWMNYDNLFELFREDEQPSIDITDKKISDALYQVINMLNLKNIIKIDEFPKEKIELLLKIRDIDDEEMLKDIKAVITVVLGRRERCSKKKLTSKC